MSNYYLSQNKHSVHDRVEQCQGETVPGWNVALQDWSLVRARVQCDSDKLLKIKSRKIYAILTHEKVYHVMILV